MAKAPTLQRSGGGIAATDRSITANASPVFEALQVGLASINQYADTKLHNLEVKEGTEAGIVAGSGDSLLLREGSDVRSQAFNASALKTFGNSAEIRINSALSAAFETNKSDPTLVAEAFEEIKKSSLEGMPRQLIPMFTNQIDKKKITALEMSGRIQQKNIVAASAATAEALLRDRVASLEISSFNIADPVKSQNAINDSLAEVKQLLVSNGPRAGFKFDGDDYAPDINRTEVFSPLELEINLAKAGDRALINRALGMFDRAPDAATKRDVRDDLRPAWQNGALKLTEQQITKLESRMDTELRREGMQGRAATQKLSGEVATMAGLVNSGFQVRSEDIDALASKVGADGDPALAVAFNNFEDLATFSETIRQQPPLAMEGIIDGMRDSINKAGGVSDLAQLGRLSLATKMQDEMRSELNRDPLSWANRVGLVDVEPVKVFGPEAAASMANRVVEAQAVAGYYGIAPKYMTEEEMNSFTVLLDEAEPDQVLGILMNMAAGFGSASGDVLAELSPSAPVMAYVGGLAIDGVKQAEAARGIIQGAERLRENPDLKLKPTIALPKFNSTIGGALAFAPDVRGNAAVAAEALYVDMAARGGIAEFDEKLYAKSVNRVLGARYASDGSVFGGVGSFGDHNLILPNSVTQDGFDAVIESATAADLVAASVGGIPPTHKNGDPLTPEDLRTARLINYQDGTYMVDMAADGTRRIKGGVDGWYVFDFNLLKQNVVVNPLRVLPPAVSSRSFRGRKGK